MEQSLRSVIFNCKSYMRGNVYYARKYFGYQCCKSEKEPEIVSCNSKRRNMLVYDKGKF